MRQFLKFTLATMLGTFLIGIVLLFLFFGSLIAFGSSFGGGDKAPTVPKQAVLQLTFDKPIHDQGPSQNFTFNFGGFSTNDRIGLNDLLNNLDKAERDDRIKGIFLDLSVVQARSATLKEIRDKLISFRQRSGKPVIAFGEVLTQGSYFLASAADEVYIVPDGDLDFRGLRSEGMYFKGLFDKLGVEMQLIRGSNNRFKSFGEAYISDHMSEASREQTRVLLAGLWGTYVEAIAASRNLSVERLDRIADSLLVRTAKDAVDLGMINGVKYRDEVLALMKTRMALDEDQDIAFVTGDSYTKVFLSGSKSPGYDAPRIAVVYAEGDITSGESSDGTMGSTTIAEALRKAREDSTVKAIVLRVNSPGGSGLASDVIWRETMLAREAKPLVVSMGDLAASGGYYIACGAHGIWAEPNTITGSIGVFGLIPNMKGLYNDKLGITFDGEQTHTHAGMFTTTRALTAAEKGIIQGYVDRFYSVFLDRVAQGRNMSTAAVDSIGQGRVWTGQDALRIGLVDSIGGLQAAIADAANRAGLEANGYRIKELPERKDLMTELMSSLNAGIKARMRAEAFGDDAQLAAEFERIRRVRQTTGIQARLPFEVEIR